MTELSNYTVTWRLPQYNFDRSFTIIVRAESPEDALEEMFTVANGMAPDTPDGQRWAAMQHRSLSVGDHVSVNSEPWLCDSAGWRPSMETDPRSMEEHIQREYGIAMPQRRYFTALLIPASELQRPSLVRVSADLREIADYVHGFPERARYDLDSRMYVNMAAPSMRMARNQRVIDYVVNDSQAAQRGNFRNDPDGPYLAGPVVIVGERDLGGGEFETTNVPARLVEAFGAEQSRGAEPG